MNIHTSRTYQERHEGRQKKGLVKGIILGLACFFLSWPIICEGAATKEELWDLFTKGHRAKYIELVIADLECWDAPTLLTAANMAIQEEEFEDAGILYHTGKIRAKVDKNHYIPTRKGGNGPVPALTSLIWTVRPPLNLQLSEQPDLYHQIAFRLEKWEPQYTKDYDPGWEYGTKPNVQEVQEEAESVKKNLVHHLRGLGTLHRNTEYAKAFSIVKAYNMNRAKDQQAAEKLKAEEIMLEIESQLGIQGYMTAITKHKDLGNTTKCSKYLENGKIVEC